MLSFAKFIPELPALLEQLESVVAAARAEGASNMQWFEWRIRARLIEEKLQQTAKPPNPSSDIEPLPGATIIPFDEAAAEIARQAIPHAAGLRAALQNRRMQTALESARRITRVLAGKSANVETV
jgi:hypothetical protein